MDKSKLYSKLLTAPKDSPVFLSPELESDFILELYPFGLFPWTNHPVTWWCPDPRCVLFPDEIHIQKNMRKFLKTYEIKLDYDFLKLITLCKQMRVQSWIDEDFIRVYNELFKQGFAHSLELYEQDELIGGIYGLILGKVFFGESMVSARKNASKIALIKLCELLKPYDFIIDCQVYNMHLEFMGAKNIARKDFLAILEKKCEQESGFENFKDLQKLL
ncbi:leucyl/phenylalanyl-tRNA--protein transferase [Campylobacter cuniculorum]|uniref:Leucyl/phenylalanyl-tRNA--protein transferase n=2 Tax=Campylobacter cuniculorum TaxID=374106 RepID=A0A1W6BX01_9BACT|nr:leucyl/phenylalanyl-tRNA--protein transferase [Campylobacter cuniculorum]ARJ56633.1 leucyl, phenylalanyl-tRNA-protein transferase [Campylobacter cuniculorum DSM 23162 = LMG 24588]QOR04107.1 leucyl/phenylalanyl-tRNA--protein transferase [Campylobacter cuniculorum]